MSFLTKIKLNYNIKLIDDLFAKEDYLKIHKIINQNIRGNHDLLLDLISYIDQKYLTDIKYKNFYSSKKFVWINSYDNEDTLYLRDFLNFYFKSQKKYSYHSGNYNNLFLDLLGKTQISKIPNNIKFEDLAQNSNIYQTLLLNYYDKNFSFLSNSSAFFETTSEPKKYLINNNSSLCYFLIIRSPEDLYKKYKNNLSSSNAALNELFNYDNKFIQTNTIANLNEYSFNENRQNWNIFSRSWIDPNVESSYRGKILKYEDLVQKPEESLISSLFHLKQHGADIEINYNLVDEFIKNTNPTLSQTDIAISNQERKSLKRDLDSKVVDYFEYII